MLIATRSAVEVIYLVACFMVVAQASPQTVKLHPFALFSCAMMLSMLAGLGSLWRTDGVITCRLVVSHFLNMGTCGAALSMILYAMLAPRENLEWYILGGVGLFALGGMTTIDIVVALSGNLIRKLVNKQDE
jgi:hypothetical protein